MVEIRFPSAIRVIYDKLTGRRTIEVKNENPNHRSYQFHSIIPQEPALSSSPSKEVQSLESIRGQIREVEEQLVGEGRLKVAQAVDMQDSAIDKASSSPEALEAVQAGTLIDKLNKRQQELFPGTPSHFRGLEGMEAQIANNNLWESQALFRASPETRINAFTQYIETLAVCHSTGVTVNEINPINIVYLPDGSLRILGLEKVTEMNVQNVRKDLAIAVSFFTGVDAGDFSSWEGNSSKLKALAERLGRSTDRTSATEVLDFIKRINAISEEELGELRIDQEVMAKVGTYDLMQVWMDMLRSGEPPSLERARALQGESSLRDFVVFWSDFSEFRSSNSKVEANFPDRWRQEFCNDVFSYLAMDDRVEDILYRIREGINVMKEDKILSENYFAAGRTKFPYFLKDIPEPKEENMALRA